MKNIWGSRTLLSYFVGTGIPMNYVNFDGIPTGLDQFGMWSQWRFIISVTIKLEEKEKKKKIERDKGKREYIFLTEASVYS